MARNVSRKVVAALMALATALALNVVTGSPAHAVTTKTYSCSDGGFTGYIWFAYLKRPGFSTYIGKIQYKINKGSQSGGNEANVQWYDGGTLPAVNLQTTKGVQDNAYHLLGGGYYRGGGGLAAGFIFDKSRSSDPRCRIAIPQP